MADAPGSSQPPAPAPEPAPQQPASDVESGKVMAVLCYIPIAAVGLIVSIVCLATKNNAFSLYHAKQALTLFIAVLVCFLFWCIPILGWIVGALAGLAGLVFMILGIVNAAQGKYAPLPLIGQFADKMFGGIQVEKK